MPMALEPQFKTPDNKSAQISLIRQIRVPITPFPYGIFPKLRHTLRMT